jgi:peptide chain release factor subunit 1
MIKRETLSELMHFRPEHYLTTTLYLTIDSAQNPAYMIAMKDLNKQKQKHLENQDLSADVRKSIEEDLQRIADFVRLKFERNGARTLVIFSCSARKFWSTLTLNLSLHDQISIVSAPYLRPLISILEDYHRFLAILVERSKARIFEVYAGEIQEFTDIFDVIPGRVRVGGFGGSEERKIERHIEDHVRRHFKHVADAGFELFKRNSHDYVILLGSEQNTNEFHHYLHNTLHQRLAGTDVLEITASVQDVLKHVARIEEKIKMKADQRLLRRLFDEVRSGGLGVVGLNSTIRAFQQGQVNMLIVEEGFVAKGYRCRECGSLSIHEGNCDYCGGPTEAVMDIVEEAVLDAMNQGCQVKYIALAQTELSQGGRIGAILRFKT